MVVWVLGAERAREGWMKVEEDEEEEAEEEEEGEDAGGGRERESLRMRVIL